MPAAPRSCSSIPGWRCTRTGSSPSRPKGELIQLPKGATPVDFAYAVHTDLGDQTVGAKINGRVMPLRTPLDNGDQVEILVSKAQHPQPAWLSYVVTGKARAKIRRWVKSKEREETVALGPQDLRRDRRAHAAPRSAGKRSPRRCAACICPMTRR